MRDIWIRAVKGITWPINNSTSRKATRRVRRKPKSSRPVRGVDRLVRLLSFASAFKSSALKVLLLSGYLTIFHCDVIIKVSVKVSFPHFGKAGWDCVTEGNINFLVCVCCFKQISLPQRVTPEIQFSKPSWRNPLFFKRILKLCKFVIERGTWWIRPK